MISNFMIDYETWSNKAIAKPAIRSIAVLPFSLHITIPFSELWEYKIPSYYANVNGESQEKYGRTKNADTISWWAKQSVESQQVLLNNQKDIDIVMLEAVDFIERINTDYKSRIFVANGLDFDKVIWDSLCDDVQIDNPFPYWGRADVSTAKMFLKEKGKPNPIEEWASKPNYIKHYALHDCLGQAVAMQEAYKG